MDSGAFCSPSPNGRKVRRDSGTFMEGFGSFWNVQKPAEYTQKYSRMWPRQISFGFHSGSIRGGCPQMIWRSCSDSGSIRHLFVSDSGSAPNQRRIDPESPESIRFTPYSGRIGLNLFGRILFWCNPGLDLTIVCVSRRPPR